MPENMFVGCKSGITSEIVHENGGYKYPMWVERPIGAKGQKSGDAYKCIETVTTDSKFGFESFL